MFYPIFRRRLEEFDATGDAYCAFLSRYYPCIEVAILPDNKVMEENGNAYRRILNMEIEPAHSSSYIYDTFMRINGYSRSRRLAGCEWPKAVWPSCSGELFYWDADFDISYSYPVLRSDQKVIHVWDLDDIDSYDKGEDCVAGFHIKIRVNDISQDTESVKALLRLIQDEDFPLYEEYILLRSWVDKRERMKNGARSGTSLTEMLGIDMTPGN